MAKKKPPASIAENARVKALTANINALKKQVQGLKNDVRNANKRTDALGRLSAKRGAAVARFVGGWDRKANSAAVRPTKSKKKR